MFELALAFETRVELLAGIGTARAVMLEQLAPTRYDSVRSRDAENSGDAWVTSICPTTHRSAHVSRKIIRIFGVFDFQMGLLICGLWVRFHPAPFVRIRTHRSQCRTDATRTAPVTRGYIARNALGPHGMQGAITLRFSAGGTF